MNLFAGYVELLHHCVNRHAGVQVLEGTTYLSPLPSRFSEMIDTGHAGAAQHPCAVDLAGDASDGGALGPGKRLVRSRPYVTIFVKRSTKVTSGGAPCVLRA